MRKNKESKKSKSREETKLSRKEAIRKGGKYAIFAAASMMLILGPSQESAAQSAPVPPPSGW